MQGTIVMLMALSGLGCHHKSCDVAYAPPYYGTGACYGGYYDGGYATVVGPSCYSDCYSSGYSGCYSIGYGGCYDSCVRRLLRQLLQRPAAWLPAERAVPLLRRPLWPPSCL